MVVIVFHALFQAIVERIDKHQAVIDQDTDQGHYSQAREDTEG